jgi:hypothetical protein
MAEQRDFGDDFSTQHAQMMLDYYCKVLTEQGYKAEPYPDVEEHIGRNRFSTPKFETLNHALWMCDQCRQFIRSGRLAKAYRWIGTIQGILLMNGVFSIMELKDHNRLDLPPARKR